MMNTFLLIGLAPDDRLPRYTLNIAVDGAIAVAYVDRISDIIAFAKLLHPQIDYIAIGTGDRACDHAVEAACRRAGLPLQGDRRVTRRRTAATDRTDQDRRREQEEGGQERPTNDKPPHRRNDHGSGKTDR